MDILARNLNVDCARVQKTALKDKNMIPYGRVALFVLVGMGIVFKLIDLTIGLRVSREEELRGLDIGEHGLESYSGFQIVE